MKPTYNTSLGLVIAGSTLLAALAAQALPYEVIFDFSRTSSAQDRDWYFAERYPGATYDVNAGTTNLIVSSSLYLTASTRDKAWLVLNDPNPDSLDESEPLTSTNLIAGTNVLVRTRLENFSSGTSGESAACGVLFGLTGSGANRSGFLARLERGVNNASAALAIDRFVNGVRGENIAITPNVYYGPASTSPFFLEFSLTTDASSTNVVFKLFGDAQISGGVGGRATSRLLDSGFSSTPSNSVSTVLTDYVPGFLGLYFEDNSSGGAGTVNGSVRYSNFYAKSGTLPPFITFEASTPLAYENGTDGAFTISRTNTTGTLTVNYTLAGTATNGVDYIMLDGTATFADGAATAVVPVVSIDNAIPQAPRTVILAITPDEAYAVAGAASAIVTIVDDEPPVFMVLGTDTNAYEATTLATATLSIARLMGNPDTDVTVNFSFGGTAVLGMDYISDVTNSLTFAPGVTSQDIVFSPIEDALTNGDRSIIVSLDAGIGYTVGWNGTALIVDDELPAETVLWSDDFNAGTSDANYTLRAASREGTVEDYIAEFAYDYNLYSIIPAPPSSGTSLGLKLSANKNDSQNFSAAVNAYPNGQNFSGNFALRMDLYANYGTLNSEQVLFGINCSGMATNWRSSSYSNTVSGDGIWASINISDGFSATLLVGTTVVGVMGAGTSSQYFHSPPYSVAGSIGNTDSSETKTWVRAELSQQGSLVTLRLNNSVLLYTNQTSFTSGNVMLGYNDLFDSTGSASGYAVIDNVRVVQLPATSAPQITDIDVSGSTVQVDFSAEVSDVIGNFKLQSRSNLSSGAFADDNTAVITSLGGGLFRATTSTSGNIQFYRVKRP